MAHYLNSLLAGIGDFGNPLVIGLVVLGSMLGLFVGAIPGLGGIVLLVLLLPFLYNISPVVGLALLLGSHSAIYYAGSTTAILINTPGAPESAATCFDGYAMTQRGRAARALGISAAATTFGGWFGALVIMAAIPVMIPLITVFHPPEYFFLAILAVVIIGQLQSASMTKGLLSGLFGFLISFFGAAPSTGSLRFTFGNLGLYSGINIAAAAIGLFAISEMYAMFARNRRLQEERGFHFSPNVRREVWDGIRDVLAWPWLTIRSAIVGVVCGVIPGIGSTAANFLSYGQAVQTSKHPERFGTGTPEGVIAPEASSISKEAGSLIPTVALGVPTGPGMAVVLAAFSILGLVPGKPMLTSDLHLVFLMVVVIAVSALLASVIGLAGAPILAKVTAVPNRVLVPFVLVLAAIGTFASTRLLLQVLIMMLMGAVGLLMRRYSYSLPAVIVGIVLGTVAENNLVLTHQLYTWKTLFQRPLTDILIAAIVAILVLGGRSRRRARKRAAAAQAPSNGLAGNERAVVPSRTWGELAFDVAWVVGAALYVYDARRFPPPANVAPLYLGAGALAVGVIQLVGGFIPRFRRFTVGSLTGAGIPGAVAADTPEPAGPASGGAVTAVAGDGRSAPGGHSAPDTTVPEPLAVSGTAPEAALEVAGQPSLAGGEHSLAESVPPGEGAALSPAGAESPAMERFGERVPGEALRQAAAIALALALVGGIYLFGYQVMVPVFIFFYFLLIYRWGWRRTLIAAAVMAGATYAATQLLGVIFPAGLV
jgi:putative tricarboxylic transport membrane protein